MHSQFHANTDNESLQTDVMRFMAIIAFCLIAILTLVKNVDAPPPVIEPVANVPEPVVRERLPLTQDPVGVALAGGDSAANDSDVGAASAANATAPKTDHSRLKPLPRKTVVTRTVRALAAPSSDTNSPDNSQDTGLSLRFASEGDFLRLISRGDVTVFAYRDDTVWALSRDYVFRNSRAPKQIYELEPNTIPRLVSEAFLRNHASPSNFTWGVSLPRRIESQIQSYIQRVGNGVLLIDRFGEVRHVGTS